MKNKKKIIFAIICMFVFMTSTTVDARTCEYGMPTPPIYYNGNWAYGQVVKFTTSASSCVSDNMYVYFNSGAYVSAHNFYLEAYLMENDTDPSNADEKAKYYVGYNSGSVIPQWNMIEKFGGNLDSAGDQTCELYMKFRLSEPLANNNYEYFPEDMFRYTICMD